MPLVDTNVLLDLITNDPIWADWSGRQLRILSVQGTLIVNPVVYAELSAGYDRVADVDAGSTRPASNSSRFPAPRCSWPAKRSRGIGLKLAPGRVCSLTSSLALTQWSSASRC